MSVIQQEHTFKKFIPFAKVDAVKREVWGIVTAEVADKSGETCDYESTVPYYKTWSEEFSKATDGKSVGNLRYMHQMRVIGKGVGIEFRDTDKEIWMGFKVTEDAAWKDVEDSVLTGFSQGGKYIDGPDVNKRYTASPSEVSLVDNPALGVCHFAFIRSDGAVEMRKVRSEPALQSSIMPPVTVKIPMPAGAAVPKVSDDTGPDFREIVRGAVTEWLNKRNGLTPKAPAPEAPAAIALVKGALEQVTKGMYDVSQFAQLIEQLAWLQRMAEYERESEGDESTVPAELLAVIGQLCTNFLSMAQEETNELIARPNMASPSGTNGLFAMNSTLRKASLLLTKAAAEIKSKTAGTPAKKEETTMSDLNKKAGLSDHLAAAKALADDHHEKMGAAIDKCAGCIGGTEAEKAALAELQATQAAAVTKATPAAAIADFQKTSNEAVTTAIASMTDKFTGFMDALAKTLEPPKAVQADPAAGRVVAKSADSGVVPTEAEAAAAAAAAAPAVPVFVPMNKNVTVDPKVRDAMKGVRGTALGE